MVLNNFDEIKLSKEILKYEEKSKKIFTQTKDTNICWRVWGQGKPIIFLHGGYGSWKHWLKQINFFSKKYSIFIPDMPGFGDSEDLTKPHTPLYVIWGEKDSTVGPYLEDRMTILRNINPDVRFHVELNSGHWIMYETPEIFNTIVSNIMILPYRNNYVRNLITT